MWVHRRTGRGVRGAVDPPIRADTWHLFGQKTTHIRAKDNTFVWLTVSPRTEQVSIYLRYISGGVTKETFIGYSLRGYRSTTVKNRHCNSSLLFFLPGGAAWQTSCFRHSGKTRFDPPNGCSPVRLCVSATLKYVKQLHRVLCELISSTNNQYCQTITLTATYVSAQHPMPIQ